MSHPNSTSPNTEPTSAESSSSIRRHLVGLVSLALLAGAVWYIFWPPAGNSDWQVQLEAACWRLGALLAVLWLAWPQVCRIPPWLVGSVVAPLVILAVKPKLIVLAVPIIIALAILKPRFGRK